MVNVVFVTYFRDRRSLDRFVKACDSAPLSEVRLIVWLCAASFSKKPKDRKNIQFLFFDGAFDRKLSQQPNHRMILLLRAAGSDPFSAEFFFWIQSASLENLIGSKKDNRWVHNLERLAGDRNFIYTKDVLFGGHVNVLHVISGKVATIPIASSEEHYFATVSDHLEIFGHKTQSPGSEDLQTHLDRDDDDTKNVKPLSALKVVMYVISFNAPRQFAQLIASTKKADPSFLNNTNKVLLNNSNIPSVQKAYDKLCIDNEFEHIRTNNIGISGGRQFIAEHFAKTNADYYICFEDDMLLHERNTRLCKMGLPTFVPNLFLNSLRVIHRVGLDFLKISFSEEYSDNSIQWAWYVLTPEERTKSFPEFIPHSKLDAPKVRFASIDRLNRNVTYTIGDVYYSNWPMWMSAAGNRKVFLEEPHVAPDERNWMRKVFALHAASSIRAGVLLSSAINHHRIVRYRGVRLENTLY